VIGKHLESLYIMGSSLLIGGIVMWIVDAMNVKWEQAGPAAIGSRIHTWQMESIEARAGDLDWGLPDFVGSVSRDIAVDVDNCGGAACGMSRASALEFSFFLSIRRWWWRLGMTC